MFGRYAAHNKLLFAKSILSIQYHSRAGTTVGSTNTSVHRYTLLLYYYKAGTTENDVIISIDLCSSEHK